MDHLLHDYICIAVIPKNFTSLLVGVGFFLVALGVGLLVIRFALRDALNLEEKNRKLHSAYLKRERAFIENRDAASAMMGRGKK